MPTHLLQIFWYLRLEGHLLHSAKTSQEAHLWSFAKQQCLGRFHATWSPYELPQIPELLEAYHHRRITPVLQPMSQQRTIFQKYSLQHVKVRFSMFFIKQTNVPAHNGKYVHLHPFLTTALDGGLLLTSTPYRYLHAARTTSTYGNQGMAGEPELMLWTREKSLEQLGNRTTFVRQ